MVEDVCYSKPDHYQSPTTDVEMSAPWPVRRGVLRPPSLLFMTPPQESQEPIIDTPGPLVDTPGTATTHTPGTPGSIMSPRVRITEVPETPTPAPRSYMSENIFSPRVIETPTPTPRSNIVSEGIFSPRVPETPRSQKSEGYFNPRVPGNPTPPQTSDSIFSPRIPVATSPRAQMCEAMFSPRIRCVPVLRMDSDGNEDGLQVSYNGIREML